VVALELRLNSPVTLGTAQFSDGHILGSEIRAEEAAMAPQIAPAWRSRLLRPEHRPLWGLAVTASAAIHGGIVLLALGGTTRWQPFELYRDAPRQTRAVPIAYLIPPPTSPKPPGPSRPAPASRPVRVLRTSSPGPDGPAPVTHLSVQGATLALADASPVADPGGTEFAVAARSLMPGEMVGIGNLGPEGPGDNKPAPPTEGGIAGRGRMQVAELVSPAGTACPTLHRPTDWDGSADGFVVAVAFVVDSTGVVDPATLRVVQSPNRVRIAGEFYSHIYAVSGTAETDPSLRQTGGEWDSLAVDDVRRHVKYLAFRPALRDGRPERSTVMVSCQSR
jgi:hypothetical protein